MQLIDQSKNAQTPLEQKRQSDVLRSNVLQIINRNRISLGSTQDAPGFARMNVALNDQSNLPIVNLSSPHFGNILFNQIADTATYAKVNAIALTDGNIDLSKGTSGTTGAGIINVDNAYIGDSQSWKNTSTWGQVSSTPTTIPGYGITDAQGALGDPAATGMILYGTNGGNPFWGAKYGNELNGGGYQLSSATLSTTLGTYVQVGQTVGVLNPGVTDCFALFVFSGRANPGVSTTITITYYLSYSVNGGSTFSSSQVFLRSLSASGAQDLIEFSIPVQLTGITGDIQAKVFATVSAGTTSPATTIPTSYLSILILPNDNSYELAGALSASIPTTATAACSAYYPTTSCSASVNVTCTPNGGAGGYTYSWAKVSGTGTITNSTSKTCTVTDTETTTDAGASFNTVVHCTVTDAALATATSGNCTITCTFTRLYNPVSVTASNNGPATCVGISGGSCTASAQATASVSGGDGSYSYSWTKTAGTGTITAGSTSATCTVSDTEICTKPATFYNTTVKCVVTDGHSLTGNASTTVSLGFKHL